MASEEPASGEPPARVGDRRANDRRDADRRRSDRRTPVPMWRRPAAYIAYGVAGALALALLLDGPDGEAELEEGQLTTAVAPPAVDPESPPAAAAPVREAYTLAAYEALLADGQGAVGQRVRTELYCGALSQVTLRDVERVNRSLAEVADANRRVPAAECRWSRQGRSDDFLLVVPPALAERFAQAPEVEQDFVRRRRVEAEVEWVGRSEALALRNAGILRALL